ncbi:hypothetical protein SELMODRAFT_446105 [Selaginella moellendorffii]|uniref:Eukaryotic translation initiation factor 3 subunit B n=1 Tax=Selaginella moellendorffii TaxID=88036 RepID=D8SNR7_SELML|nr:eukaryotic translation initiation factor 3 subunit B [Selaginella moellendorffii]EFJ13839.1 hypothetical protein SELMODRAFT_446105 [Selaginella moellendorffii]|eukprot:XP_002984964.1 eukaryotic translation initiation factor 3 subunit B [Selaginella moellendorffii]
MAEVALPYRYDPQPSSPQQQPPRPGLNIDWSQVNLDEIQLPPGEDFGIKSEDEEEEEEIVESESGFGSIIVVDNLPVVEPAKYEKLENVVRKIFGQMGIIRTLFMPKDKATGKTSGFAFIEYSSPQEAHTARDQADGYKLDKSHVFMVRMFDDIDKYMKVPEQWVAPEIKSYVPGENLLEWLMDEKGRDQFVIRFGTETEVCWNDARLLKAETAYHRSFWTESFVQWSPLGTYLATIHRQGAVIWGGCTNFSRITRFIHQQVRLIDFSPSEKFLVTYSSHEPSNPRETQKVVLNVFDVRSGKSHREFKGSADEFATGGTGGVAGVSWPVFRWSGGRDDKYFARIGKHCISVYETETMGLLDKKSLKVDNVIDFSWSPTDSILALFVPEGNGGNQPARVSLVQIPGREELRQKNLFSVSDCKMYWQSNGDYLAVKVDRYTKTKKSTYTGFELFRIKERDIPIEVLELENKNDKIIAFAWEPKGHRFAIIHGDGPRPDVTFYSMKSPNNVDRVTKLATLKGKQANALYWSPAGRFIVLAGLKAYNGQLEFYNVDDLETMATAEHFMATDVDWDPAGRYVATSVTSVHQMENGFIIWSFHGKLIYKVSRDRFFQFLWRPRPPSLLSSEEEAEIFRNLKQYSKRYDQEDIESSRFHSTQELEQRRKLIEEWNGWLSSWKQMHEADKPYRQDLRDGEPSDDEQEYEDEEVEIEEVIDVEEIKEEDLEA